MQVVLNPTISPKQLEDGKQILPSTLDPEQKKITSNDPSSPFLQGGATIHRVHDPSKSKFDTSSPPSLSSLSSSSSSLSLLLL